MAFDLVAVIIGALLLIVYATVKRSISIRNLGIVLVTIGVVSALLGWLG